METLDGLLTLKLVAERRSFAAAATALRVSPSAVSQTIKQLEKRLGVPLLSRTTRSLSPTEAGERFLSQAGPAMDQILAALSDVGTYASKPSGLLRINMPRLVYPAYLAPILVSFAAKYPEVCVELFFEDSPSDIVAAGFDAGIRLSDILAKDMVATRLFGPVRFVTAAAPKYLKKRGRPRHPQELLGHSCLCGRLGSRIYDRWEFQHKAAEFEVQVKPSLIFNDFYLLQSAAMDGAGIVYTFEHAIRGQLRTGKLEIVLETYVASSTGFYLYYPKRSQTAPKLRAFIDHLKARSAAHL
jgi:DNA-binding transcriptional LysR family regulator